MYAYNEPTGCAVVPAVSPIFLCDDSTEVIQLFRVLSGTCSAIRAFDGALFELDRNYFDPGCTLNASRSLGFVSSFQEGVTLSDYEDYLKKIKFKNRKFYKSLLPEVVGAVVAVKESRNMAAFVHIYRAYERLAYAFPMVYAASTNDYLGSFENLRNWIGNGADGNIGELRFHKKSIQTLFYGQPIADSTVDIFLDALGEDREVAFQALVNKILGWRNPDSYTADTVRPDKISIKFLDFHSFIINLRNRFFHYSNGNSGNLDCVDLICPEAFFGCINERAVWFVAVLFHELIIFGMAGD